MADGSNLSILRDAGGDVSWSKAAPAIQSPPTDQKTPAALARENLAAPMTDSTRMAISDTLTESIAFDEDGMSGVEKTHEKALELLGLGLEADGDSTVDDSTADDSAHTLMLEALLTFESKSLAALLPSDDMIMRTEPRQNLEDIEDEAERKKQGDLVHLAERRVQDFYTDYFYRKLPSYPEDTDQIIRDMGMMGCGLRKIVVDRSRRTTPVMPEYVPMGHLLVSYGTKNFRHGRITHRMDVETGDMIRRISSGMYRPVRHLRDRQEPERSVTESARAKLYGLGSAGYQGTETHRVYEVYTPMFLEADMHPQELPRPYIVSIHKETREVLSILRNWNMADPDEMPLEHFVGYLYHPGMNAVMGVGLGQILMQVTRSLRRAQRRGLEAAYRQNHPSGFKLSSLTIRDDETKIKSGSFVDVDSPTGDIRAAVMLHPFEGPSPGLMTLSEGMEENGRKLGGIATIDLAQLVKAGTPVAPAMAAFEEATEFQTAVHRRQYLAQRREFEIVHERMQLFMGSSDVQFGDGKVLKAGDLALVRVLPHMKPGQASKQKTVMEALAIWDVSKEAPDVVDRRGAAEGYVRSLGSPSADALILPAPQDEEVKPADPVTEYVSLLAGRPLKVGPAQNHQAHIDSHAAQMRLLQTSSLPIEQGDAIAAALAAHIAEHMGMQMMVDVAARLGIPLEQLGPEMPPQVEMQIAPAIAEAIAAIEAERRPPSAEDTKVTIEKVKQAGAAQREQVKAFAGGTLAALKAKHEKELLDVKAKQALELQESKDDAAMEREIEDNATALKIANAKGAAAPSAGARATARTSAGASAGASA